MLRKSQSLSEPMDEGSGTTQSSGGKEICQKSGEGFRNSMPTCALPSGIFTETRHPARLLRLGGAVGQS